VRISNCLSGTDPDNSTVIGQSYFIWFTLWLFGLF